MRTSVPGNEAGPGLKRRGRDARWGCESGFTLIELLVVVALIAVASATVSLAVRDPDATQLEREAARLAALLEAARAESRASGVPVWWVPAPVQTSIAPATDPAPIGASSLPARDFRYVGLPADSGLPERWLAPGLQAQVMGAPALVLGPEPLIGPQRLVLQRGWQRLVLATDGLAPFAVVDAAAVP